MAAAISGGIGGKIRGKGNSMPVDDAQPERRKWIAAAYTEYHDELVRFARRRLTLDFNSADDIVQNVFVALLVGDRPKPETLLRYLRASCRFEAWDIFRSKDARRTRTWAKFYGGGRCVARTEPPYAAAEFEELQEQIEDFINRGPPEQQRRLRLRIWGGRTGVSIAAEEGVSHQTINQSMRRALHGLCARFGDIRPRSKTPRLAVGKQGRGARGPGRPCWCVDLSRRFGSIKDAAEFAQVTADHVRRALNCQFKTAGGYHWEWREHPASR